MRKNILIIKLSAMGDIVMASPVIAALKKNYPESRITWLVEDRFKELLVNDPKLDEIITWPKLHWKRLFKERKFGRLAREANSFIKELRKRRFDTALDIQGLLKSALFAFLSGAKERIGISTREGSGIFMTSVFRPEKKELRISSEYLNLVEHLGIDPGDFGISLSVSAEDNAFALNIRKKYGEYLILSPFTTRPQKHWIEERWGELSHKVRKLYALTPILLGGIQHIEEAKRICAGGGVVNLTGKCSMGQSMAVVKHASLLIGVDTGLTHMAAAFEIPTAAIFGSTCPYTDTVLGKCKVVHKNPGCSPCRRSPTCNGNFKCMTAIQIDDVLSAIKQVLS